MMAWKTGLDSNTQSFSSESKWSENQANWVVDLKERMEIHYTDLKRMIKSATIDCKKN
jgi:hypothetical protein